MGSLRIAVGSDHGGFEQKEQIAKRLTAEGHEVTDFGCPSTESVDYPDYAAPVAQAVARGDADFGILVCGTGIGMMLAANKVKGIRAANVTSVEFAHLAREHNNANVVTLSRSSSRRNLPVDATSGASPRSWRSRASPSAFRGSIRGSMPAAALHPFARKKSFKF